MGKQGKRAPDAIRAFIIKTKRNAQSLSNGQIENMVVAEYGEGARIDKSTVGRILRSAPLDWSRPSTGATNMQVGTPGFDLQGHWELVGTQLNELKGIEPFSLHDRDIATWWARPNEPSWPIPKGRAWRQQDGSLEVRLDVELRREWNYLRQHLEDRGVWDAIENCKKAVADDMAARMRLMDQIAAVITGPQKQGGLGLSIEPDLGFILVTRSEVTVYYLFTIFDQVLSRALGLQHAPKRSEEFEYRDPGYPEVVSLGGIPVVRSTDAEIRQRAVSFLIEAQGNLTSLPEAAAAAKAYRTAEAAAKEANDEIQDVLLMPGFPPGTTCDLCKSDAGLIRERLCD